MAGFISDLLNSIFTPGPTPSIVVATNASFAALQLVLLVLLILTYSIHFVILSGLSAGLWWAINWFVTELQAANQKEEEAQRLRNLRKGKMDTTSEESGTETEETGRTDDGMPTINQTKMQMSPEDAQGSVRKRRSLGEANSGDLSTDSEWDKVDEAGEMKR